MLLSEYVRIRGKVQGVFFRESLRQEAQRLGVTGWVRNRSDGSVEALLQGEADLVKELEKWCHRGPPTARVDSIEVTPATNESPLTQFLRKDSL